MYFHPDAAAEAFDLAGMRGVVGITVIDFPTPYASDVDDYFRKGLAARERWQHHPLLSFTLAPTPPTRSATRTSCAAPAWPPSWTCRSICISTKPPVKWRMP